MKWKFIHPPVLIYCIIQWNINTGETSWRYMIRKKQILISSQQLWRLGKVRLMPDCKIMALYWETWTQSHHLRLCTKLCGTLNGSWKGHLLWWKQKLKITGIARCLPAQSAEFHFSCLLSQSLTLIFCRFVRTFALSACLNVNDIKGNFHLLSWHWYELLPLLGWSLSHCSTHAVAVLKLAFEKFSSANPAPIVPGPSESTTSCLHCFKSSCSQNWPLSKLWGFFF